MKVLNESEIDQQKQSPCADEGSEIEAKNNDLFLMLKGASPPHAARVLQDVKNLEGKEPAMTKTQTELQDHDYCKKNALVLKQNPTGSQNLPATSDANESLEGLSGNHGDYNKMSEHEKSPEKAEQLSEVENSRQSMERMLGGTSDWDRKVEFLSYLGMVLKTSLAPSYQGSQPAYHWRYNLRARESPLGKLAEGPKLKSKSVSSRNRRRVRNKTSAKGSSFGNVTRHYPHDNDSKKVTLVVGGKVSRRSQQAKNGKRASHWSYNLRGQDVVNYKETKRAPVVVPSIAPMKRKTSRDARRLNPVRTKRPRSQVKEKQDVLHGKNGFKNKQHKTSTNISGQCAELSSSQRPKNSAAKSSKNKP